MPASDEGQWELTLWNGAAWFSEWFYRRLQWPMEVNHEKWDDLESYLPDGAWESLLLGIRDLLERQVPLNLQLRVQLSSGRIEWWRILGAAERNAAGLPVYLAGSARELSAEHRRDALAGEPRE